MTPPSRESVDPEQLLDMELSTGGDDWQPTPHGRFLARMLAEHDLARGADVLELGAGAANHTIILLRQEPRSLVATEISAERLETTRANVARNVPDARNVEYRVADWLNTPGQFDLVVTNPPFAKSGKRNRRYFIDALILDAHKRLRPGGSLVFVQSSMAGLAQTQAELERNGYAHEILGSTEGPWRDYYFDDPTSVEEARRVPNGFAVREGTHYETLFVLAARLLPWTPPYAAH